MDEVQGRDLVERLRRVAGEHVEELTGTAARDFVFISDIERRPTLLGSFRIADGDGDPFFVSVVGTGKPDAFQFFVMERTKGSPILGTSQHEGTALVWRYRAAKQSGNNEKRNEEFRRLAGTESLRIPLPADDVHAFAAALRRALDLRHKADAAGGDGATEIDGLDDRESVVDELRRWYPEPSILRSAAKAMVASIRRAHALNPRAWCVTWRRDRDLCRLNVGIARVFDLRSDGVLIAINVEGVPAAERAALGDKLDLSIQLNRNAFGENGVVVVAPSDIVHLGANVTAGHDGILARAARHMTPFARHHNPEILEALRAITAEDVPNPELPTGAVTTAYWKIAPGEQGEDWLRCREGGFIGIGWWELGDLSSADEAEFQRRVREMRAKYGWGAGVDQVWKFRSIAIGDRIVANAGTTRVLGIGTVVGPYFYQADDTFAHRLPVRWDDVTERRVEMLGWRKTLIRLTESGFEQIKAVLPEESRVPDPVPVALPIGGIDFEGVITHLENQSLSFPAELVASYLLALQARRFVLLTGISGTGKTQLALEVARLLSPQTAAVPGAKADDGVDIAVKPYMVQHGRIVVPASLAREFAALFDVSIKRLDLELPGGVVGSAALYKDPERPGLLYVLPSGELKRWFNSELQEGQRLRLRRQVDAQGVERLVIGRGSDANASDASSEPAVASYELVAVRPDWTDARALLGFYNPLTKRYATTPTLELVLRAQAEVTRAIADARAPRPFFLVFDEMNRVRIGQDDGKASDVVS